MLKLTGKQMGLVLGAALCGGVALNAVFAADAAKPKYTIKEIMKQAHEGKTSLSKRVSDGMGTKADFAKLLDYYKAMALQSPPKGDAESWKTKTAALVTATEGLVAGKDDALTAYKTAVDCKACHTLHRPPPKK
jgi:hypothetical protein